PTSCDPLNRRAVRVSMGSVFLVPWTFLPHGNLTAQLRALGLTSVALALTNRSVPIDYPALKATPRLAMILGTEGDGLADEVIDTADFTARIPMSHGVDSLNVAAASALAFWELRTRAEA
ncbi:MAG: RNA methyltransferase, partial [Paramuribaculum sp.]|nr:RNA methyltransferase [Paramuribaculum sp.]